VIGSSNASAVIFPRARSLERPTVSQLYGSRSDLKILQTVINCANNFPPPGTGVRYRNMPVCLSYLSYLSACPSVVCCACSNGNLPPFSLCSFTQRAAPPGGSERRAAPASPPWLLHTRDTTCVVCGYCWVIRRRRWSPLHGLRASHRRASQGSHRRPGSTPTCLRMQADLRLHARPWLSRRATPAFYQLRADLRIRRPRFLLRCPASRLSTYSGSTTS
jgi:hypothetical protein